MKKFFAIIGLASSLAITGSYYAPEINASGLRVLTPLKSANVACQPSDISGLQYWFKTDAGVTQSLGAVSAWADQSGNGRNATASNPNMPVYATNQLNGLPSITFSPASSQRMTFGSDVLFTSGSASSVVFVATVTGTGFRGLLSLNSPVTNRFFTVFFASDASYSDLTWNYVGASGSPVAGVRSTTSFTSAASGVIVYNGGTTTSTSSWEFYKNNSSVTVNTSGNGQGTTSLNFIGAFGGGTPGSFYSGPVYEIFGYNSALTSGQRACLKLYITNKWGV